MSCRSNRNLQSSNGWCWKYRSIFIQGLYQNLCFGLRAVPLKCEWGGRKIFGPPHTPSVLQFVWNPPSPVFPFFTIFHILTRRPWPPLAGSAPDYYICLHHVPSRNNMLWDYCSHIFLIMKAIILFYLGSDMLCRRTKCQLVFLSNVSSTITVHAGKIWRALKVTNTP